MLPQEYYKYVIIKTEGKENASFMDDGNILRSDFTCMSKLQRSVSYQLF